MLGLFFGFLVLATPVSESLSRSCKRLLPRGFLLDEDRITGTIAYHMAGLGAPHVAPLVACMLGETHSNPIATVVRRV
jgi:hypothetical protein